MITNIDRLTTRCCKETQYTEQYQYFSSHNSQKGHLVQSCQVSDKHHKDIPHKLATRCGFVLPTYKYTTKNAKSNRVGVVVQMQRYYSGIFFGSIELRFLSVLC